MSGLTLAKLKAVAEVLKATQARLEAAGLCPMCAARPEHCICGELADLLEPIAAGIEASNRRRYGDAS